MNFYFEMAINILEVTLILSFLVQYFGYRIKYPAKYIWTIIIGLVSFCNIAFFSWNNLYESYASSLQILINIIFCCVLLCGPLLQKIFVSAFTMGLVAIIATFTTLLISKLSESDVTFLLSQFSGIRITSILLTKLLFFIITRIILRIKETGRIKWLDFMPLVVIPALSIITITLVMYAAIQEPHIQNIVFYAVCIILALNILFISYFVRLGQVVKYKPSWLLLVCKTNVYKRIPRISKICMKLCALYDTILKHLLCISSMANEKDIQGIQQYTQQLLQQQNAVSKLITFSGNTALDAIVNSKSTTAEHVGVQLRAIITTPLSDISPEDITIILGNALDNAIRAAKDSIGKTVDLYIQPQGAYNSIVIINDIARSVLSDNPTLTTTKVKCSQHGFGIKNIRQAVERNQGMLEFFEQNNRFECDILLLNIQSRNDSYQVGITYCNLVQKQLSYR